MYTVDDAPVQQSVCVRFGERVRELRIEREITQDELAERVGTFRTYMSRIETGVANPTLTMIHALADALNVPVAELVAYPKRSSKASEALLAKRVRAPAGASRGRVK